MGMNKPSCGEICLTLVIYMKSLPDLMFVAYTNNATLNIEGRAKHKLYFFDRDARI